MSLIGSRVALTHTCTIQRNQAAADTWGQQGSADWVDHLTGQVCRAWTRVGRQAIDANTVVVVKDARLVVPLGTDVTESDRVGDVIDAQGNLVLSGPTQIRAIITRRDHLELVLVSLS